MAIERALPGARTGRTEPGTRSERLGPAPKAARVAPTAKAAHRPDAKTAFLSTPARAGILLGASAAVYAVTLAGVSGLQAETSNATAAARASGLDAVARARAANDRLQATVDGLDASASRLVAEYTSATDAAAAYQTRLDALASLVAEVQGTAANLPARIQLPSVTVHGAISGSSRSGRAPATSAKTGASGH